MESSLQLPEEDTDLIALWSSFGFTNRKQNSSISLDHLSGDCNDVRGYIEAESPRCFQIDDELIR